MIRAILDTNVILQSLIGSETGACARILDAYFAQRFRLVFSEATLDELLEVLLIPRIRARHDYSDTELLEFLDALRARGDVYDTALVLEPSPQLTRDLSDVKFLQLATVSTADVLVTNDRRHLLPLRQYGQTRIISPGEMINELD